jgi:hypothetical protein
MLDQYQRKVEHQEMLAGIIASTVANWSMGSPKKPLRHIDFMPSQWMKEPAEPRKRRVNHKALAAKVRAAFANAAVSGGSNGSQDHGN